MPLGERVGHLAGSPVLFHSSVSDCHSLHHVAELLKLDLTVVVLVDLVEQLAENLVVLIADSQRFLDLRVRNRAAPILVEQTERCFQLLLTYQIAFGHGRHDELCVVNGTVAVDVDRAEHSLDLLISHLHAEMLLVAQHDFLFVERAVAIFIHELEDLF